MLSGIPESARCVQRFDDSLNSAIHITYHISLRSSSMREPRDPLLKVFFCYSLFTFFNSCLKRAAFEKSSSVPGREAPVHYVFIQMPKGAQSWRVEVRPLELVKSKKSALKFTNDPSAGSPTETLLRLLLPLNDQVRTTSQQSGFLAKSQ